MVNLRMLALAAAILIAIPIVVAADPIIPGGTLATIDGGEKAAIDEIQLIQAPTPITGRSGDASPEQLVEGHTTFLVLTVHEYHNQTTANVTILGNVSCGFQSGIEFVNGPLGIPVPEKTQKTTEECDVFGTAVATPDPFFDPAPSSSVNSGLYPTGASWSFTAPDGEQGTVTEYAFDTITQHDDGTSDVVTHYAWAAPILHGWALHDGRLARVMIPIPTDHIRLNGPQDKYHVVFGKDVGLDN